MAALLISKTYFHLLFLAFCFLISFPPTISSLPTVSISEASNQILVCALDQQSFLHCARFPSGIRIHFKSRNFNYSGIVAGNGFLCFLRSSLLTSVIGCWRFSTNFTNIGFKRIYRGHVLDQLEAGNTHICGLEKGTNQLKWWQWPKLSFTTTGRNQNLSSIAVGEDFLCGLNGFGNVICIGNITGVVPSGNYSVIAAGFRHACAISSGGSLVCWGDMRGEKPGGKFTSLALGENRSCALRICGTVVCWGANNFSLPTKLQQIYFAAISSKRTVFCGILSSDYSLLCWGNEILDGKFLAFKNVKPGACRNECPCGPLPDSTSFCGQGLLVCQPCILLSSASLSPSQQPPKTSKSSGWSGKMVVLLVVGVTGSICFVTSGACFMQIRHSRAVSSRVHDSGRLDEDEMPQKGRISHGRQGPEAQPGRQPVLEKRLSHIISLGCGGHLKEFSLQVLLQATNNFSRDHKIGSGGFGSVYRATLEDGREVAIKRAEASFVSPSNPLGFTKRQEDKHAAFVAELQFLSRLNHKNLVRLLGFCEDNDELVLVYEYMSNGTLHEHLHKLKSLSPLASWSARLKVALDAARGIEYLHAYAVPPIIHRDIKSSNILLNANWRAKVSDFGLSLMSPQEDESHLSLRAAGTVGYIDPEYYRLHQLTAKSDVYSFGVVLLELLSGHKAIHRNEQGIPRNVVDFIVPYIARADILRILDASVPPPTPAQTEAVAYIGYLAADCVSLDVRYRPSMTEIVNCLERAWTECLPPESYPK
ncbi:hypothetical protein Ancab_036677 [Ancistrocladus abbreviatus]